MTDKKDDNVVKLGARQNPDNKYYQAYADDFSNASAYLLGSALGTYQSYLNICGSPVLVEAMSDAPPEVLSTLYALTYYLKFMLKDNICVNNKTAVLLSPILGDGPPQFRLDIGLTDSEDSQINIMFLFYRQADLDGYDAFKEESEMYKELRQASDGDFKLVKITPETPSNPLSPPTTVIADIFRQFYKASAQGFMATSKEAALLSERPTMAFYSEINSELRILMGFGYDPNLYDIVKGTKSFTAYVKEFVSSVTPKLD